MEEDLQSTLDLKPDANQNSQDSDSTEAYPVNNSAEIRLETISVLVLIFGIIAGVVILFTMSFTEVPADFGESHHVVNPAGIALGIATIVSSILWWTVRQVFVNISYSLKNIAASVSKRQKP